MGAFEEKPFSTNLGMQLVDICVQFSFESAESRWHLMLFAKRVTHHIKLFLQSEYIDYEL